MADINAELRGMRHDGLCFTAGQLAALLACADPESLVLFASDYGDYRHTVQALPVGELVETDSGGIGKTTYSDSGLCVLREERSGGGVPVVILKAGGAT